MVPEALFHPSDAGLDQGGLAEAVAAAAAAAPPRLRPLLLSNILLAGGGAACPGLEARLAADVRPLLPDDIEVCVRTAADPGTAAWRGGSLMGASPVYAARATTREAWEEERARVRAPAAAGVLRGW